MLLEPAYPDVNDHLGDAYWRVGRKIEARFQWSRVLTIDAPDDVKARAQAKLDKGLEAAPAPAVQPAAASAKSALVASAGG